MIFIDLATTQLRYLNFTVEFSRMLKLLTEVEALGSIWKQKLREADSYPFKAAVIVLNIAIAVGQYVYNYDEEE